MRILHLGKYYPPYPGGIEAYCQIICEGLYEKGVSVDVIVSNNTPRFRQEIINGVRIFRLPRKGVISSIPVSPKMPGFVKKMIRDNNYTAVHLHFPNPMAEVSFLLSGFKGNFVVTYHTDASMRNRLKLPFFPVIKSILKSANYIILTSENYLKSRMMLRQHLEKCRVVPIPVNPFFLKSGDADRVSQIKKIYREFILFVGNLASYKGQNFLIKAMTKVDCSLVMIGVGHTQCLDKLVHFMGLDKRVYFLEKIDDNELRNFYDACAVFCLPSVSAMETFGIVLLEAMARAKPVISTEIGTGTSWVNQDGITGLVVPPKSSDELSKAINTMLNNTELRTTLGANAKKRVLEHFAVDNVINSIINLYEN